MPAFDLEQRTSYSKVSLGCVLSLEHVGCLLQLVQSRHVQVARSYNVTRLLVKLIESLLEALRATMSIPEARVDH